MNRILRRHQSTLPYAFRAALNAIPELGPDASRLARGLPLSKIVATIGPASEHRPMLDSVVNEGLSVMRINFSHATFEEADLRTTNLNAVPEPLSLSPSLSAGLQGTETEGKMKNMRGVMLDTQGPEIRTGSFAQGVREMDVEAGQQIILTVDPAFRHAQSSSHVWISYTQLPHTVREGSVVLLDDGAISLTVESVQGHEIHCRATNGGSLGNKKGVNLPRHNISLPALSPKDEADLVWGVNNDIDFIAASFVRKPDDVLAIRAFITSIVNNKKKNQPLTHHDKKHAEGEKDHDFIENFVMPQIVSKIESTEGLVNFDAILGVSDAVMVARGDLGVEIALETLPAVQKEIVRRCVAAGKPVVVATQMLESMQKNPRPTRAEALDVANAVLDGADAVMLSGESAKGKFPAESVRTMRRIAEHTELSRALDTSTQRELHPLPHTAHIAHTTHTHDALTHLTTDAHTHTLDALARAAVHASHNSSIHAIVCHTHLFHTHGRVCGSVLPRLLSQHRPGVPVYLPVPTYKAGRQYALHRAIKPILVPGYTGKGGDKEVRAFLQQCVRAGVLSAGESVVQVREREGETGLDVVTVQ